MFNSLNVAQSGLKVAQVQVENVMNNLANENTAGYKSRTVNTAELDINDLRETGRGAVVQGVERSTSVYMYQNLLTEESKNSSLDELNIMLEDIESIFYETDDAGLSADLNRYFASIENLKASPSYEIYKNDLVNNANVLIENMQILYSEIEQREATTLGNTKNTVKEINGLLKDIGDISFEIQNSTVVQHDLLDKRDRLEKELAEYIDVDISREDQYMLEIGGVVAVRHDNNVRDIKVAEDYEIQRDVYTLENQSGYKSSIIDTTTVTWDDTDKFGEIQRMYISGDTTGQVNFLGTFVAGSAADDTAATTAINIVNDSAAIISNWNTNNPDREIASITSPQSGELEITYKDTEGDVANIDETSSVGVTFVASTEKVTQKMAISGVATAQVEFLGTLIAGSAAADTAADTATKIVADATAIIDNWNAANPGDEIATITSSVAGELEITYVNSSSEPPAMADATSEGITFVATNQWKKGVMDSITYTLNNKDSIEITVGEVLTNASDTDGDGINDADLTVDSTNIIQALVYKINNDTSLSKDITAYNGSYALDSDGNKVLRTPTNTDYYLIIESNTEGEKGAFKGEIIVNDTTAGYTVDDDDNPTTAKVGTIRTYVEKNELISKQATDDIHLEVYESEIPIESGRLKSMIDNLNTNSQNNKFADYKEQLDQLAYALSDLSSGFIENDDGTYVYGLDKITYNDDYDKKVEIGLFSGASVRTLSFTDNMVNTLDQEKLDYLASLQWKDDVDFDGSGENKTSFSIFYQELRVNIADDRENIRFRKESQAAVTESLENNYNKLTKVDKDTEMIELIKYQASYEANARMITVVDEMLATILGMKR